MTVNNASEIESGSFECSDCGGAISQIPNGLWVCAGCKAIMAKGVIFPESTGFNRIQRRHASSNAQRRESKRAAVLLSIVFCLFMTANGIVNWFVPVQSLTEEISMYYAITAYAAVVVFGLIGWVWNIVKIVGSGPIAEWGAMEVVRCLGVFAAPLGAVLGYF